MPRETEGGYNPSEKIEKRDRELFENNVNKLVARFVDREDELKELMEKKREITEDENRAEEHEHASYEVRTFEEALKRIEAKKEKIEK